MKALEELTLDFLKAEYEAYHKEGEPKKAFENWAKWYIQEQYSLDDLNTEVVFDTIVKY